ncbi:cation:proton antiporter [Leifsonia sp. A12D58]|uniref:cation:proton antiporter n=1 Tax=Leifsonia sp. A12D58 TaxID=3397674 RepID=UPI0039E1B88C
MEYAVLGLASLLIIVAVATIAPKLGVAAPLVLVVVGIACSFIPWVPVVEFPPELILALVLPPILYSSAVNVPLVDFRRNLKAITSLSVLLVIVSALVSGLLLYWLLPDLSLAAAIALGAVISPPDAVAATSIGKRLGLPPRLVTVLEGEGLVNDASALVLLRSAVAATAGAVSLWQVAGDFIFAVIGAIVVGIVIGYVTVWVRSKLDNPVLNTTISFAVPFLAFIPAEEINASGVLAVVVAGLITGHRSAKYFSARDRINERFNWRTIQFLLENGVFLLMGFELQSLIIQVKDDNLGVWHAVALGLVVTVLLIVIRVAFVVPLIAILRRDQRRAIAQAPFLAQALDRLDARPVQDERSARVQNRFRRILSRKQADFDSLAKEGLGWRGGAVLAWSGMRGVVTLAAAQSLPLDIPYRPQLILIAFTVAVVTLLAQGGTLPWLIKRLGIVGTDEAADRAEFSSLVSEISQVGAATLDNPNLAQDDGAPFDPGVIAQVRVASMKVQEALSEDHANGHAGPHEQQRALRLRVLEAERAALLDARTTGSYSSRILDRAQRMLDAEESRLQYLDEGGAGH